MAHRDQLFEFVCSDGFLDDVGGLLDDEDLHRLEDALLEDPRRGAVLRGTGGFRKIRVAVEGRGKRGGARVIYYSVDRGGRVYFIMAYPKNEEATLTEADKKALRAVAHGLEEEI